MDPHDPARAAMRARPVAWRLSFAAALALMMGTGTYAGYAFGVLGPDLVVEFDLSRFELGAITATFFLVGGPLSLLAGPATDRFGARRLMLIAFALAAAAIGAMALAPSYLAFLAAAALAGLALAAGNPVTNKLVAIHVAPGGRGLIMGGKQSGVQVAAFLTGALLAPVAVAVGWRTAFGWSALVPLAGVIVALLAVPRDPPEPAGPTGEAASGPLPASVYWLAAYAFLMGSGVATINAYLPLYLVERAGATQELAGGVAATVGLVGIGSRIAWGWGSERMRGYALPLLLLGAGAVVAILLVLAVERAGLWLAWPAAALLGATAVTWNSVGMLAVITSSGAGMAGRASGVVVFGFYIGFVASPVAFGWLVDRTDGYASAWLLVAGIFALTTVVIGAWRRSEAGR
ncbi:MAG TPA: MFS transporter [Candidatus Limnocylindria bacterium]|nr:MFS transporter [Candidatus Limnocylindria bacterium]